MSMAVSMAAMMAPSAAPFFIAYRRDTGRSAAIAVVVLVYVAAWATIGVAADALMNRVMIVPSWQIITAAAALAVLYTVTPWARRARSRCRQMCAHQARDGALSEAARYTASCVACNAGIMAALIVIGMTNALVVVIGAATMFVYKVGGWRDLRPVMSRIR
ncbi:MAG TPA: DUF2182 domain-containing protein [Candidatus Dormibacteraeota bacterium]|nr:DUF2182 domain-containing protein [Candidatus Dormibacteraeota bacterium]